jgi:hypothetical protein
MLKLGEMRMSPKVMVHQVNDAQTRNHDRTKRTPEPKVIGDNIDAKNETRIYLGNPCKGRLYHLITTLLKH